MPALITNYQEILPHPLRGTADPTTERIVPVLISIDRSVEVPENEYVLPFVTSDGSEDRHGSRINPNGWDDSHYERNPVVLWSHQNLLPAIGRGENMKRTASRGTQLVRFAVEQWRAEGVGNLAMQVFQLCRDGFINMGSESFIPKEWREMEATTIPSFFAENIFYERVEKTEFSIVNVGSNRNAQAIRSLVQAGKISENEAGLLGLSAMLRFETPIMVRTEAGVVTPKHALPIADFREKVGAALRCCGCYPAMPEMNPISEDAARVEVDILNEIATEALSDLDSGVRGWKAAEREDFRWLCRDVITSSMWRFEIAAMYLKQWHDQEVGATIPEIDFDEVDRALEGVDATRVGKVFSAKNLAKIDQIISLAEDLRAAANTANGDEETEDEERDSEPTFVRVAYLSGLGPIESITNIRVNGLPITPDTIIKIGDEPTRDRGSDCPIRVVAPDDGASRDADDPTPKRDVYRLLLAD